MPPQPYVSGTVPVYQQESSMPSDSTDFLQPSSKPEWQSSGGSWGQLCGFPFLWLVWPLNKSSLQFREVLQSLCEHLKLMLTPLACKYWARNLLKKKMIIVPGFYLNRNIGKRSQSPSPKHALQPTKQPENTSQCDAMACLLPSCNLAHKCQGHLLPLHRLCSTGWITAAGSRHALLAHPSSSGTQLPRLPPQMALRACLCVRDLQRMWMLGQAAMWCVLPATLQWVATSS